MSSLDHVHLPIWHAEPAAAEIRGGRDRRWLERAAKAAREVTGKWRIGCVLVRGGSVLAVAANSVKNDPKNLDGKLWLSSEHAEMAALRLAGDARGATAYIARVGADGTIRHAQPCLRCAWWLEQHDVHSVWTSDPAYIARRNRRAGRQTTPQRL